MQSWFNNLKEVVIVSVLSMSLILVTLVGFYDEFKNSLHFWLFALVLYLILMFLVFLEHKFSNRK